MKAIIMAGGKGTRLRPLTDRIPKPMVPLIDRPALEYTVELLRESGIKEIAVTLGYMPEKVTDYFGDGKRFGVDITYFYEEAPLGTAGGVKNTGDFGGEDFFVISGDAYTEIDLKKAALFHYSRRSLFTVIAQPHPNPVGLGILETDFDNRITSFIEKPEDVKPALVNTGIYIINKGILRLIPDGFYDFGKDLLPRLIGRCYAYIDYSYWSDIGTLSAYYDTNKHIAEKLSGYPIA